MANSSVIGKVYHYVAESRWNAVLEGRYPVPGVLQGKSPLSESSLWYSPPDWARKNALYAFLNDPAPETWTNNPNHPGIWWKLMDHIAGREKAVKLLEFDLLGSDEAWIFDYGHRRLQGAFEIKFWRFHVKFIDEITRAYHEQMYIGSGVPAAIYDEFMHTRKLGVPAMFEGRNFLSLPELVILNSIPLERIVEVETLTIKSKSAKFK